MLDSGSDQSNSDWLETIVTVRQPEGVHLRAGKEVVTLAASFSADLEARNLSRPSPVVNLKSILALMRLQARAGHQLQLRARGADADAALAAMHRLFDFDLAPAALTPPTPDPLP